MKIFTFIGAGPSNLFSILYLLEELNYPGEKILLIEQGESPLKREGTDLLKGFGGAGAFSDGKYIFSKEPDTLFDLISKEESKKYQLFIQKMIEKFLPHSIINKTQPVDFIDRKKTNLTLRQADCWHLGTNNNKEFLINIYNHFLLKDVSFLWNTKIVDIDFKKKYLFIEKTNSSSPSFIKYNKLQIGVGKIGSNFIKKICASNKIKLLPIHLQLGGRFETPFNSTIEDLIKIQYDFKLFKKYNDGVELRTFCVNNKAAYVVQEKFEDFSNKIRIQYNGHAYINQKEKINNLTNFGILAQLPIAPELDIFTLLKVYEERNMLGNKLLKGNNFNFKSSLLEGNPDLIVKNYPKIIKKPPFFDPLNKIFLDFIEELDKYLDLQQNWLMYFPEIKISIGKMNVNPNFQLKEEKFKNITWVGDACVGTRGIVPAAISGIKAINNL